MPNFLWLRDSKGLISPFIVLELWILFTRYHGLGLAAPRFHQAVKFVADLWFLSGPVLFFRGIFPEVVELQSAVLEIFNQFPFPMPDNPAWSGSKVFKGRAKILAVSLEVGWEMPEQGAFGNGVPLKERT